jgi:hypothetical protein
MRRSRLNYWNASQTSRGHLKLDKIRLATPEEVEKIAATSDLTPNSRVLAMRDSTAVWRIANEIDPVYFNSASNSQKYLFIWGLENMLRGTGATEYYMNVSAEDAHYQGIIENFGAVRTSKEPEYRYKVTL